MATLDSPQRIKSAADSSRF